MNAEPTITCPSCRSEIKLTESLAAPLIDATRRQYEDRLRQANRDMATREAAMKDREERIAKEKESLDASIAEKLKAERHKLALEAQKAAAAVKAREEQLAREKESLDAAVAEKLKVEREQLAAHSAKLQQELARQQEQLRKQQESLETTLAEKMKLERARIAEDEARKARVALGNDIEEKARQLKELNDILKQRDEKLAEAQKAQAELIRKGRELDDARREMDLTIEKRVQESLGKTREQAKKEAEEKLALKVIEKEEQISAMARQIEDLKRRAEQGSQQLQGEALELQLESLLAGKFPHDRIDPVPKGEHGGDILQRVVTPAGVACGTILWETKQTKNWSDGWLAKLRDDQRSAKAEIAIIVSAALPRSIETFDQVDGVWVVHPRCILPVAMSLRHMLVEVNCARQAGEGQGTKMEMIYTWLTGPRFRMRVQAIVEAFTTMSEDLQKERKAITRQWAKREQQLAGVIEATVGMYGELQGIAGKSLQEIEGLELPDDDPEEKMLIAE